MSFFAYFKEEFQVIQERDPAIHSPMEVLLYPSFRVMLKYRRAHKLYLKGHYFLARWISQRAARKTGIEIHPGATIGKGLFIDHGAGVIIGETTVIGDNVTLYQGVTLGGNGKETGKRQEYPGITLNKTRTGPLIIIKNIHTQSKKIVFFIFLKYLSSTCRHNLFSFIVSKIV